MLYWFYINPNDCSRLERIIETYNLCDLNDYKILNSSTGEIKIWGCSKVDRISIEYKEKVVLFRCKTVCMYVETYWHLLRHDFVQDEVVLAV